MRRLRAGLRALGLATTAVAVGAGLVVLVTTATGPVPGAHAEQNGAEPGMIVVTDRSNSRLQAFYPDGTFAFKFGAGYGYVNSIDIGPDGMIVTAGGGGWIEAFHPNGTHAFRVVDEGQGVGRVSAGGRSFSA